MINSMIKITAILLVAIVMQIAAAFLFMSLNSCAMGSKPYKAPERKLQDKLFRPCQDFETSNPIGKLCNRTCKKKSCTKEEFTTIVKDFNDPETFKWFRAGSFIMIDEDQVL